MKIRDISEPASFFKAVNTCAGRVELMTAEGDCLIACGDMLCVDDLADLLSGDAHGLARLRLHVLRAVEKHAVCQCVLFVVVVHRSVRLSCYRIWPLPVMTYL